MRDDYWTLSFPRLTQDASGDFYPDHTKDDTMTTDQPAWATDPRGLPPAVQSHGGRTWGLIVNTYSGFTPAELETLHGPLIPLWPDTPPTSIDPADIRVGMRVRRVLRHKDGDRMTTTEGIVTAVHPRLITLSGCVYCLAEGGDWFLVADAPYPAAHWIRAIAEATPETAPTVYAAIKGEQA